MPDFSQQYGQVTPYDSKLVTVLDSLNNCLVTVSNGQLRVIHAPQTFVLEGPVAEVRAVITKVTGKLGGGVQLYTGGHRWLMDFNRCYRAAMAKTPGGKVKLFLGFGGVQGIKTGRRLRDDFVSALDSQGAQIERE